MTSELELFRYGNIPVRVVILDGEPWFVLADLCKVLDLEQVSRVKARLDDGVTSITPIADSLGRMQQVTVVSEPGMYEVVLRSDKPEAVAFRRWITGEVLPSIRRTGSYGTVPALTGPELLAAAVLEAQSMIEAKDQQIAELEPRAEFADKVLTASGDYSVADAAKILSRAGIDIGPQRLFGKLESLRWIFRGGDKRWRIYQTAIETGWMLPLPQWHYHPQTGERVLDTPQPRITAKGVQRLLQLLGGPRPGQLELVSVS